jgi:hypothetical protein
MTSKRLVGMSHITPLASGWTSPWPSVLSCGLRKHKEKSPTNMTDFWPKKPFTIAVVGGGLSGLALARGLIRRGISTRVFEAAPAFADIGAGLSFAVNSLEALRLVDPDSYQCFLDRCNEMSEKKDVYMTYRDGEAEDNHALTTLYCKGSGQQAVHRTLLVKVRRHQICVASADTDRIWWS